MEKKTVFSNILEVFNQNYYDRPGLSNSALNQADSTFKLYRSGYGSLLRYKMYIDKQIVEKESPALRIGSIVDAILNEKKPAKVIDYKVPTGGLAEYVKYIFDHKVLTSEQFNNIDIKVFDFLFTEHREHCTVHGKKNKEGEYSMKEETFLNKIHALDEYWRYLHNSKTTMYVTKEIFREVKNCIEGFVNSHHNLKDLLYCDVTITDTEIIPRHRVKSSNKIVFSDVELYIPAADNPIVEMDMKCKIDFVIYNKESGKLTIVDLKTGAGITNYASTIISRKYHRQVEFYKMMFKAVSENCNLIDMQNKSAQAVLFLVGDAFGKIKSYDTSIVVLDKTIPLGLRYNISENLQKQAEQEIVNLTNKIYYAHLDNDFINPEIKDPILVVTTDEYRESLEDNDDDLFD